MTVKAVHLVVACNVLADAQVDQITDRAAIYARIRAEAGVERAAELFSRAVALNSTLGGDGVARLLGIADGDTIPEVVFDVASRLPLQQVGRVDGSADLACKFDRKTFVAALRARWHLLLLVFLSVRIAFAVRCTHSRFHRVQIPEAFRAS